MHPLFDAIEHDKELTISQRLLLVGIYRHMDGKGGAFPSYKKLEAFIGSNASTVSRNLKILVERDWLKYEKGEHKNHKSNTYQLNLYKLDLPVSKVQKTALISVKQVYSKVLRKETITDLELYALKDSEYWVKLTSVDRMMLERRQESLKDNDSIEMIIPKYAS